MIASKADRKAPSSPRKNIKTTQSNLLAQILQVKSARENIPDLLKILFPNFKQQEKAIKEQFSKTIQSSMSFLMKLQKNNLDYDLLRYQNKILIDLNSDNKIRQQSTVIQFLQATCQIAELKISHYEDCLINLLNSLQSNFALKQQKQQKSDDNKLSLSQKQTERVKIMTQENQKMTKEQKSDKKQEISRPLDSPFSKKKQSEERQTFYMEGKDRFSSPQVGRKRMQTEHQLGNKKRNIEQYRLSCYLSYQQQRNPSQKINELKKQINVLREQHQKQKLSIIKQQTTIASQMQKLQKRLNSAATDNQQLKEQINKLTNQLNFKQNNAVSLKKANQQMKVQLQEANKAVQKIKSQNSQNQSQIMNLTLLKKQLQRLLQQISHKMVVSQVKLNQLQLKFQEKVCQNKNQAQNYQRQLQQLRKLLEQRNAKAQSDDKPIKDSIILQKKQQKISQPLEIFNMIKESKISNSQNSCYILDFIKTIDAEFESVSSFFQQSPLLKNQPTKKKNILEKFIEEFSQKSIISTEEIFLFSSQRRNFIEPLLKINTPFIVLLRLASNNRIIGVFSTGICSLFPSQFPEAFCFSLEQEGHFYSKTSKNNFPYAARLSQDSLMFGNSELVIRNNHSDALLEVKSELPADNYFFISSPWAFVDRKESTVEYSQMEIISISF